MFKKMAAVLLSSCLVFGTVGVMASDEATVELNWEDFVEMNGESDTDVIAEGSFVAFDEIACQMWVPDALAPTELTDEEKEAGYIAYYSSEDGEYAASVMYVDVDGMTLEEYAEELKQTDGVTEVTNALVNGLPCVGYDMDETDITCLALGTEAGYILEFAFAPMSDEDYADIIAIMMASIQPEEEAAASAAESTDSAA